MMSALQEAQRKIHVNDFRFDDLPEDRQDPIWNELLKQPFQLSVQELCAQKCSVQFIRLHRFPYLY